MIISKNKCRKCSIWEYSDSRIAIYDFLINESFSRIEAFFDTHFNIKTATNNLVDVENVIASISLFDINQFNDLFGNTFDDGGEHFIIRNSNTERFKLAATEYVCSGYSIIRYDNLDTILAIKDKEILAFINKESEVAIIELIRDLIMKDQENRGNLFLHAAAVEKDNRAYIICGIGGAGKTTTLLELINNHGYRFLSGDKVLFACKDEQINVMGWPDYPNLGVGTIRRWDALMKLAPSDISERKPTDKFLLDFERFYKIEHMAPYKGEIEIGGFLFPNIIHDSEDTRIEQVDDITDYLLNNFVYKEDYDQRNWQKVVVAEYNRDKNTKQIIDYLKNVKAIKVEGNISSFKEEVFA